MASFPSPTLVPTPQLVLPAQGIIATVPVHDGDAHTLLSGVQFEAEVCDVDLDEVDFEQYADCIRTAEKEFRDGIDYVQSFQFSLYRGIVCRTVGRTEEEERARAERRYLQAESRGVARRIEQAFLEDLAPIETAVDSATDAAALAFAAAGGVVNPVLLTSRAVGVYLNKDSIVEKSGGSLVIDDLAEPWNIYVSGPINIWRGPLVTNVVLNPETNERYAITERQYAVTVECPIGWVAMAPAEGS